MVKPAAPECPPYLTRISETEFRHSTMFKPSILLQEAVATPSLSLISIIILGL